VLPAGEIVTEGSDPEPYETEEEPAPGRPA